MSDQKDIHMKTLLEEMIHRGASDLHITVQSPPLLRIDGELQRMNLPIVTGDIAKRLAYSIMTDRQKKEFEENWELDLSFGITGLSRFRVNVFLQRGNVAIAIRAIPTKIKCINDLNLPPIVATFSDYPKGLVLITGPTGSGKSTTLAAIIDKINSEHHGHIITVEDPIEFVHNHKSCIINQREVGSDTKSFATSLKYALRQDPDVVLIGEMRDLETMQAAMQIAETGHLAFATLHTNSAAESIGRIIDVFPVAQQTQVRVQLAFVLQAVLTQQLIPKIGGGRTCATEIMIARPAIRAQIREDKVHQIYSSMQAGQKFGMMTMNQAIANLYLRRQISLEEAHSRCTDIQEINEIISRARMKAELGR